MVQRAAAAGFQGRGGANARDRRGVGGQRGGHVLPAGFEDESPVGVLPLNVFQGYALLDLDGLGLPRVTSMAAPPNGLGGSQLGQLDVAVVVHLQAGQLLPERLRLPDLIGRPAAQVG